ncbi:hypothetical protein HDU76_011203 [Blyttiomyces sp. JEL0837]|nr:hypothetical protein HDU76_011203 [Blyttiomyces sp. JEL0837]
MADDGIIDHAIFDQLTEMDEDPVEREFSKGIVLDYFGQAENTFANMDASLEKKDLGLLSRLGHFLKGSSAALGLVKVKASCEKMQHYGNLKDNDGSSPITEDVALARITQLLGQVKLEYREAEAHLRAFFGLDGPRP